MVVEDERLFGLSLARFLGEYFTVDRVEGYDEALDYIRSFRYEVMLLDRMLNGADRGLTLIEQLKACAPQAKVIVISAKDEPEDKIEGLNTGADDYLHKPIHLEELLARIRALTRRDLPRELVLGVFRFDLVQMEVWQNQERIGLTRKEHDLLFALIRQKGHVVSREQLVHTLYNDPTSVGSNTVEVLIRQLRKKLIPELIVTVKTRGYHLNMALG